MEISFAWAILKIRMLSQAETVSILICVTMKTVLMLKNGNNRIVINEEERVVGSETHGLNWALTVFDIQITEHGFVLIENQDLIGAI